MKFLFFILLVSFQISFSQGIKVIFKVDYDVLNKIKINERNYVDDENGNRWITTNKGLYQSSKNGIKKVVLPVAFSKNDSAADNMYEILKDKNQYLWVTTNHFVYSFSPSMNEFRQFKIPFSCKGLFITQDDGIFLFGEKADTGYCIAKYSKSLKEFIKINYVDSANNSFTESPNVPKTDGLERVNTILESLKRLQNSDILSNQKEAFLTEPNRGWSWREVEDEIYFYYKKLRFHLSKSGNQIEVAPYSRGDYILSDITFTNFLSSEKDSSKIANWVKYDTNSFSEFKNELFNQIELNKQYVIQKAHIVNDSLLLILFSDALIAYNTKTNIAKTIQDIFIPENKTEFKNDLIEITQDFFVFKLYEKLFKFNIKNFSCTQIKLSENFTTKCQPKSMICIYQNNLLIYNKNDTSLSISMLSQRVSIWKPYWVYIKDSDEENLKFEFLHSNFFYCVDTSGISILNFQNWKEERLSFENMNIFNRNYIPVKWYDLNLDQKLLKVFSPFENIIWMIYPGMNIMEVNFKNRPGVVINPIKNYLGAGDSIVDVHFSNNGNVQILTTKGLYFCQDGLLKNQYLFPPNFLWSEFSLSENKNGRMYAVGMREILKISTDSIQDVSGVEFKFTIDSIYVNGNLFQHENFTWHHFSYSENSFTFFVTSSVLNKGFYRLEPWDAEEIQVSGNQIKYKNLRPGRYSFSIGNKDGLLSHKDSFIFTIDEPFWKTPQFFLAVIILAVISTLYFQKLKTRRKEEKENIKTFFEKAETDLKLALLRSQLNPHFIYNCLNAIKSQIAANAQIASGYLEKFADLLRKVLEYSEREKISLAEEEQVLTLYLEMEKMRFEDKLEFSISIAGDVDKYNIDIPPLLLQPVVENAIWHGILPKEEGGKVEINAGMLDDEVLEITVRDNGIGRKRSAELKKERAQNHTSFGTRLTQERIELLNQNRDNYLSYEIIDLTTRDGIAAGTLVTIKIRV